LNVLLYLTRLRLRPTRYIGKGEPSHRERRIKKQRCLTIEIRETEIDELIRMGLLKSETRNSTNAVIQALYAFLDRTLDRVP
jgi:hypothetical protein